LFLLSCVASAQTASTPTGDEIMRRVIARRAEIRKQISSLAGTIYVRTAMVLDKGDSKFSLTPRRVVVDEALGGYYHDDQGGTRVRIVARHRTELAPGLLRNLIDNYRSLQERFSVDDERIVLLNTAIISPLASDAFRYYTFRLAGVDGGGSGPYQIEVRSATTLYPTFNGTITVTKPDFELQEVQLEPSETTVIPFVHRLALSQKFSPVDGIYQPEAFYLSVLGEVEAVAFGVASIGVQSHFQTRLIDRRINVSIPDSMRLQPDHVMVLAGADSVPDAFWKPYAPDASRAESDSISYHPSSAVKFSALPMIDYNRAGAVSLTLQGSATLGPVTVALTPGYSFGLKRPIGEGSLAISVNEDEPLHATLRGSTFSQITTTTTGDKSNPSIMNTLVTATLHQDYYNYFRKDGWSAGGDLFYDPLRLSVTFEESRQFSVGNNARWALLTWTTKEFQENPPIADGEYRTLQGELAWGRVVPFLKITPVAGVDVRGSLTGLLGTNVGTGGDFRLAEALASISIPVMQTGYNPMTLTLLGAAGAGTASLPPQYQFRLRTSAASFGKPGGFVSPPKGLYGGTEYLALGAEYNFTDLLWRATGLPTYKNRGLELIVAGASARYRQRHESGYTGTGDQWYSEAGFALSRIPLFLTDLIYGRADARWGLGPLGKFNANFTLVLPL
jgi:hypothetical protein